MRHRGTDTAQEHAGTGATIEHETADECTGTGRGGTAVVRERGMIPVAISTPGWAAACAGVEVLFAGMPRPGTGLA